MLGIHFPYIHRESCEENSGGNRQQAIRVLLDSIDEANSLLLPMLYPQFFLTAIRLQPSTVSNTNVYTVINSDGSSENMRNFR